MNIHEFEAKRLFAAHGITTPKGQVAVTPQEAERIAQTLGGTVVVKAQIHAGGRGKGSVGGAGTVRGVKVVSSAKEAAAHAEALLGQALVTHQTGPEGRVVKRVLVEEASDIRRELYVGLTLDRDLGQLSFLCSTEGGMDIEEVAARSPDKIVRMPIDPASGMQAFHRRGLALALGLEGQLAKEAGAMLGRLYGLCVDKDLSLIEVNPLVVAGGGRGEERIIALDGKVNVDDNALFRQPELLKFRDLDEEDAKERAARDASLSYVALEGNIGCLVNGAGLAMATMDIIKTAGGQPANFLDVGGGATATQVAQAFKIILADPHVRAILVNIFGGIAKCDVIAEGIIAAAREVGLEVPLVVRLEGTNVEAGKRMLAASGLAITAAGDMADAAHKAVAAARGAA